ncbi:hypothetical protein COV27_00050 [candidate division WWE3 bacterium CG10_big_fil_rev_8_21_14_0_10_39_14]|nr:MAG: hypothetical protein COV27_00050 [candidate division WWE3 bacterium CG10_big_fil_rev_8_21_14_0_10_39_14]
MKMKDNIVYLKHIVESIDKINEFINGLEFADFKENSLVLSATVRELEIIGEASGKLSKAFREKYNDIPWDKAINMRNRLIHEYFGVDEKIVWNTCKEDLPKIKVAITPLILL